MAKMRGPRFKLSRRLGLNIYGHPKAMDRAKKELVEQIRSFQIMDSNY